MSAAHLKPLTLSFLTLSLFACGADELETQNTSLNNSPAQTNDTTTTGGSATSQTSSGTPSSTTSQTNAKQSMTTMQSMTAPETRSGKWWLNNQPEETFQNRCAPSEKIYDEVKAQAPKGASSEVKLEGEWFDTPCPDQMNDNFYSTPVVVPRAGKSAVLAGHVFRRSPYSLSLPNLAGFKEFYVLDPEEQLPSCFKVNENHRGYQFEPDTIVPIARQGKVWIMPSSKEFDGGEIERERAYNPGVLGLVGFDVTTGTTFIERYFGGYISGEVTPRVVTSNGQLIVESRGHIISLSSETGETYWSFQNNIATTQIREYGQDGSILIQGGGKAAVIDRCGKQTKVASTVSDTSSTEPLFKQSPAYQKGVLFDGKPHELGGQFDTFSLSDTVWGAVSQQREEMRTVYNVILTNIKDDTQQTLKLHGALQAYVDAREKPKEGQQYVRVDFRAPVAIDANRIALVGDTEVTQYVLIHNIKEGTQTIEHLEMEPSTLDRFGNFFPSNTKFTSTGKLVTAHQGRLILWSIAPGKVESPFPLGLEQGTPMNMPLPVP